MLEDDLYYIEQGQLCILSDNNQLYCTKRTMRINFGYTLFDDYFSHGIESKFEQERSNKLYVIPALPEYYQELHFTWCCYSKFCDKNKWCSHPAMLQKPIYATTVRTKEDAIWFKIWNYPRHGLRAREKKKSQRLRTSPKGGNIPSQSENRAAGSHIFQTNVENSLNINSQFSTLSSQRHQSFSWFSSNLNKEL